MAKPFDPPTHHDTMVLNLCGSFGAHKLDLLEQRPMLAEIAYVPSAHDFAVALAMVKY